MADRQSARHMLDVFLTVDTEIWCGGWQDLDQRFPSAFRQYVYGRTSQGDYGLPYQLQVLEAHGLTAVFFVEPLFSARFGTEPLAEIVGLLKGGGQEIELHLHTEWVDESRERLLENVSGKRQHLRYFSLEEQTSLIAAGIRLIKKAGAADITAFRAGSFAFNSDTLRALRANGIRFDSSYNASVFGPDSGVLPGITVVSPIECEGVYEYPMTVFDDGTRTLRHVQVTACSYREMEGLLWQAVEVERSAFVILSTTSSSSTALAMGRRCRGNVFRSLCSFLDRNRDCFRTRGFRDVNPRIAREQPAPLASPLWRTGVRMLEQAYRRRYG